MIENFNKLNKLKIDTSISTENDDKDGGFTEESIQYSMISDLVNFESDNENCTTFNRRQENHISNHKKSADFNHTGGLENIYFNQESPLLSRKISASDGSSSRIINSSLYDLNCNIPALAKDEFTTKYDSLEYDI